MKSFRSTLIDYSINVRLAHIERNAPKRVDGAVRPASRKPTHGKSFSGSTGSRGRRKLSATDRIAVVIPGETGLLAVPMRWQLTPPWWKQSLKELPASSGARSADTVDVRF